MYSTSARNVRARAALAAYVCVRASVVVLLVSSVHAHSRGFCEHAQVKFNVKLLVICTLHIYHWSPLNWEQISLLTINRSSITNHLRSATKPKPADRLKYHSFGVFGLSSHLVQASYSSHSYLYHLSLFSAPVHFPFFVEWNAHAFPFWWSGTEWKHHFFFFFLPPTVPFWEAIVIHVSNYCCHAIIINSSISTCTAFPWSDTVTTIFFLLLKLTAIIRGCQQKLSHYYYMDVHVQCVCHDQPETF